MLLVTLGPEFTFVTPAFLNIIANSSVRFTILGGSTACLTITIRIAIVVVIVLGIVFVVVVVVIVVVVIVFVVVVDC